MEFSDIIMLGTECVTPFLIMSIVIIRKYRVCRSRAELPSELAVSTVEAQTESGDSVEVDDATTQISPSRFPSSPKYYPYKKTHK
jgi:hypothetical protein